MDWCSYDANRFICRWICTGAECASELWNLVYAAGSCLLLECTALGTNNPHSIRLLLDNSPSRISCAIASFDETEVEGRTGRRYDSSVHPASGTWILLRLAGFSGGMLPFVCYVPSLSVIHLDAASPASSACSCMFASFVHWRDGQLFCYGSRHPTE